METHIYIATDAMSPKTKEVDYTYAIEAVNGGSTRGRAEGAGKTDRGPYCAMVMALQDAVARIRDNDRSDIVLHVEDSPFLCHLSHLDTWAATAFIRPNRQQVCYADSWRKIWNVLRHHKCCIAKRPNQTLYLSKCQSFDITGQNQQEISINQQVTGKLDGQMSKL